MLNTGLDLGADVYQVGHHGSRTSSSSAFLQRGCSEVRSHQLWSRK